METEVFSGHFSWKMARKTYLFINFSELRAVHERFFEAVFHEGLQHDEGGLHQLVEGERQLRCFGIVIGDAAFQRQGEAAGAHCRHRVEIQRRRRFRHASWSGAQGGFVEGGVDFLDAIQSTLHVGGIVQRGWRNQRRLVFAGMAVQQQIDAPTRAKLQNAFRFF